MPSTSRLASFLAVTALLSIPASARADDDLTPPPRTAPTAGATILGVGGGLYVLPTEALASARLGVHVRTNVVVEVDVYGKQGTFSVAAGTRVFLTETFSMRWGLRMRNESGSDPSTDAVAEVGIGNRWYSGRAFIGADWITAGTALAHGPESRAVEIVMLRAEAGLVW